MGNKDKSIYRWRFSLQFVMELLEENEYLAYSWSYLKCFHYFFWVSNNGYKNNQKQCYYFQPQQINIYEQSAFKQYHIACTSIMYMSCCKNAIS